MEKLVKIVALAVILTTTIFLAELSAKFLFDFITPSGSSKKLAVFLGEGELSASTGDFENGRPISEIEILPYYLYRNKPGAAVDGIIQINSWGHRGEEIQNPKDSASVRILAIGGSTTYGWLLKDFRESWPFQLQGLLEKKLLRNVEVINAGLPGGTSVESLVAFMLRDRHLNPDIIILHNGGNDAEPLMYPNYRPDYAYMRAVIAPQIARKGERLLLKSYLMRVLYSYWLSTAPVGSLRSSPLEQPTPEDKLKNVSINQPIGFERNVDAITTMAQDQGAYIVFFPFVLAGKEIFETLPTSMRYAEPLYEALSLGLTKNIQILQNISQKRGVSFVELPKTALKSEDFFDHCHLKASGEKVVASFLADEILRLIVEGKIKLKI